MTTLLVASLGGHLKELHRLSRRLTPLDARTVWVTNDGTQSRSLLAGEDVVFVPHQGVRNVAGTTRNAVLAAGILRANSPTQVISTGSGIALSFLPLARLRGAACHYVESGTRIGGPSVTGKVLQRVPGVHCYTQHSSWANGSWHYRGSVLEGFRAASAPAGTRAVRRAVVMLGTYSHYCRPLLERLITVLPRETETLWQTGHTPVDGLPIEPRGWIPHAELTACLREADVVVTHAGIGGTLDALEAGKCPIIIPRRKSLREAVDDHQVEFAAELGRLGLAIPRAAEELSAADLAEAAGRATVQTDALAPFRLEEKRD